MIIASSIGRGNTLADIPVIVTDLPNNGTLVYDGALQAFTIKDNNSALPAILGAGNVRGDGVFYRKDGDTLLFREIQAGAGISLTAVDDVLTIRSTLSSDRLSVPGSYRITIDNDNNTVEEARFELWTARSTEEAPVIIAAQSPVPCEVTGIHTGNDGTGYLMTADFDFVAYGFRTGQWISVSGTTDQDGYWQIATVENLFDGPTRHSYIRFTEPFTDAAAFNLGGPQYPTILSIADFAIRPPDVFASPPYDASKSYVMESSTHDFGPLGWDLRPGMIVQLRGCQKVNGQSNDGNYTIASVMARDNGRSAITVTADQPFAHWGPEFEANPYAGNIRLIVRDRETPTGFYVTEKGDVAMSSGAAVGRIKSGPNIPNSLPPIDANDLVRKDYVDARINRQSDAALMMFLINT